MKLSTILTLIVIAIAIIATSLWMGQQAYSWLPPQAAAEAELVDDLFSFLVTLGTAVFLGVGGTLVYSAIAGRVGRFDYTDGPPIEGNNTVEIVWTAIPLLLVFWIATYSYQTYQQMAIQGPMELVHIHIPTGMEAAYAATTNSEPTETIEVLAKQWSWTFHYPDQNVTSSELHLPVNRRVHLAMRSQDVIHGLYVPAFRLKQDIEPNKVVDFEFTPIREGTYRLNDSQFSGTYFAIMQTNVIVQSPADYSQWLTSAAAAPTAPADNQPFNEYTRSLKRVVRSGWPTVAPAPPPLVNQLAEGSGES